MFLNTAKFNTYTNTFNNIMDTLALFNQENCTAVLIINNVRCACVEQAIYNIFPKDWIIYGEFYDKNIGDTVTKYFNVRDLSYATLHYLQTKINQIEAMCDNSIQCFDDFLENSSTSIEPFIYNRPGL